MMNRKGFLKNGIKALGTISILPLVGGCEKASQEYIPNGNGTENCSLTPSETAGPFPTKNPASMNMDDITSDRVGVPMKITLSIQNKNNNCSPVAEALVDIWHCDKDGYYSEYGGVGMQKQNFKSVHFLRGRQVTNAAGQVGFTSVFPGWYRGRAPHIHVHIYDKNGDSLLVTQIAFEEKITDTVYTTATNFYTNGKQDTTNSNDTVFSDGAGLEKAKIFGNITDGYQLTHTIVVDA